MELLFLITSFTILLKLLKEILRRKVLLEVRTLIHEQDSQQSLTQRRTHQDLVQLGNTISRCTAKLLSKALDPILLEAQAPW